jgi:hypothetical protein
VGGLGTPVVEGGVNCGGVGRLAEIKEQMTGANSNVADQWLGRGRKKSWWWGGDTEKGADYSHSCIGRAGREGLPLSPPSIP